MKMRNAKPHGLALVTLLLAFGLTACSSNSEMEGEPGVIRRVAALLARVPRESIVRLSATDTLHVSAPTTRFYRWRLYRSAWTDGEDVAPARRATVRSDRSRRGRRPRPALVRVGLGTRHGGAPRLSTARPEARAALLGELDLVLTEGFSRYARDLIQERSTRRVAGSTGASTATPR